MKNEKEPAIFSRCSCGRNRWYWVVWTRQEDTFNGDPPAFCGYGKTSLEAEHAAVEVIRRHIGWFPDPVQLGTAYAAHDHRRRCAIKKSEKVVKTAAPPSPPELLYTDHWSDYDGSRYSAAWRIVKKTKKKVFVTQDGGRPDTGWQAYAYARTYALDRQGLENKGETYSRAARHYFRTTPWNEREEGRGPQQCFVDLGLTDDHPTSGQVKEAYHRLARQFHPDCGGDAERFKKINASYRQALDVVTG